MKGMKKFLLMMALVILMVMPPTTTSAATAWANDKSLPATELLYTADFGKVQRFTIVVNCADILDFLNPVVMPDVWQFDPFNPMMVGFYAPASLRSGALTNVVMISVEDDYNGSKNIVNRTDAVATLRTLVRPGSFQGANIFLSEHITANTPNAEVPEVASRREIVASR